GTDPAPRSRRGAPAASSSLAITCSSHHDGQGSERTRGRAATESPWFVSTTLGSARGGDNAANGSADVVSRVVPSPGPFPRPPAGPHTGPTEYDGPGARAVGGRPHQCKRSPTSGRSSQVPVDSPVRHARQRQGHPGGRPGPAPQLRPHLDGRCLPQDPPRRQV